jgi:glutaredoxin
MKKIITLVLIVVAAYLVYKNYGSMSSDPGAFDDQGNPTVLLFTIDGCGQPCADVAGDLRSRNVTFEEVNVATDEGRSRIAKFGVTQVPLTVIGKRTVIGSDLPAIEAALAEAAGMDALSPAVQNVMRNHFDDQGKPKVVLYGTETCSYCKRMRAHLDERKIPYQFVDVSGFGSGRSDFETLRGRGYPLIFVGYRRIDGYNEAKVDQAVKELL